MAQGLARPCPRPIRLVVESFERFERLDQYAERPWCAAGLILAWRLMPEFPATRGSRLDSIGLALASPGIAAVVFGLAQVGTHGGFGHPSVLLPLLGGLVLTLTGLVVVALATVLFVTDHIQFPGDA
jgi:hypothetical protein